MINKICNNKKTDILKLFKAFRKFEPAFMQLRRIFSEIDKPFDFNENESTNIVLNVDS